MGCDIHTCPEKRDANGTWVEVDMRPEVFGGRDYDLFGFLADVRNYSAVDPIAAGRGLPDDSPLATSEYWNTPFDEYHSVSWVALSELLAVDYDKVIENRRITVQTLPGTQDNRHTAEHGEGRFMPLREFLGESYFVDLERMRAAGVERLVFGFDS